MSTQTNKMVDIATMTIEAAETEEAIGSTDESDSQDQEFQVCVWYKVTAFSPPYIHVYPNLHINFITHTHTRTHNTH